MGTVLRFFPESAVPQQQQQQKQQRRKWELLQVFLGFWLLGLINNSSYVIMIAGANEIAASAVGLVYFCAIGPTIIVKLTAPYWFHLVRYSVRFWVAALLMAASFCIVALSTNTVAQLLGVALVAVQGGLGEASALGLCALHPNNHLSLTAWSSGTGFAGIMGYAWVAVLHYWLKLSYTVTLLIAVIMPGLWLLVFHRLMRLSSRQSRSSSGSRKSLHGVVPLTPEDDASQAALLLRPDSSISSIGGKTSASSSRMTSPEVELSSPASSATDTDSNNNQQLQLQQQSSQQHQQHHQQQYQQQQPRHTAEPHIDQTGAVVQHQHSSISDPQQHLHTINQHQQQHQQHCFEHQQEHPVSKWHHTKASYRQQQQQVGPVVLRVSSSGGSSSRSSSRCGSTKAPAAAISQCHSVRVSMPCYPCEDGDESSSSSTPSCDQACDRAPVLDPQHMSALQRLKATCALWPYMVPLFVVYFAEYAMQSGTWTAVGFPVTSAHARELFYLYSNWLYQAGVCISRSSGMVFQANRVVLWIMPALQCLLLVFFGLDAVFHLWWNWGLLSLCFVAGLLGGAVYVNSFTLMSQEVHPALKEFSLSAACVADSIGIACADLTAIVIQGCLFKLQGLTGAAFSCGAGPK